MKNANPRGCSRFFSRVGFGVSGQAGGFFCPFKQNVPAVFLSQIRQKMRTVIEPYSIVFINNPVVFEWEMDNSDPVLITVNVGQNSTGLTYYPAGKKVYFDVSDILRSLISNVFNETGTISRGNLVVYNVICGEYSFSGRALPGGISKALTRELEKHSLNIFTAVLLNRERQFLLTTRSFAGTLYYRRNEIESICFLSSQLELIAILTNLGDRYDTFGVAGGTTYINLRNLISRIGDEQSGITRLDFLVAGNPVFKIIITDSFSEEAYLFRFRNSYGALDMIELTGKGTYEPEFSSDNTYNEYNEVINDLQETRERVPYRETLKLETGYRTRDQLMFLRDFVTSSEIYLVDRANNQLIPCLVNSKISHQIRQFTPESVAIEVRFVDEELNYSPGDFINLYDGQVYTNTLKTLVTNTEKSIILNS